MRTMGSGPRSQDAREGGLDGDRTWSTIGIEGSRLRPASIVTAPSDLQPRWAVPVFVVGALCSLVVAVISAQYFAALARGMSPSLGFAYTLQLTPFLLAALPLLWLGTLALARPWTGRRPWLRLVLVLGVIGWLLLMLQGPAFLPR